MSIFNKERIVYEDDKIVVIMKDNPSKNGELLLTTKEHLEDFTEINEEVLWHIHKVLKDIKYLICDKLNPTGINIINSYGENNKYNCFYLDIIPVYYPEQPLVDIDIIFNKLK